MMRAQLLGSLDAYTEGSGCISQDDLVHLLASLGLPGETAKKIVESTHLSRNGQVDCKEFVKWSMGPPRLPPVLPPLPVCVASAQELFRVGLLGIGLVLGQGGDVPAEVEKFVGSHYTFGSGPVMFSTRVGHESCRYASSSDDACEYFCNPLTQYVCDIKLENESIVTRGPQMFAQGHCVFSLVGDLTRAVDFTFGYEFINGTPGLFLHHSCDAAQDGNVEAQRDAEHEATEEIAVAQQAWADGLMEIAAVARAGGDCIAQAEKFVDCLYAYSTGQVLFKTFAPTTAEVHFGTERDQVVKYFGNPVLQALTEIRFENACSIIKGPHVFVRGIYHFTTVMGTVANGEYVFGYERDAVGGLSIFLQHSSAPFL